MFGNDDNQQQQQTNDNNGPLQAAMPDPLPASNSFSPPPTNNPFNGSSAQGSTAPGTPDYNAPELTATSTPDPVNSQPPADNNDDLMSLKQQALQHLSPLVSHLDQSPEEKFRTTMMMIQASDDQTLIKSAFEAAKLITDDKARAQAFLDVINEINYFTQRQN